MGPISMIKVGNIYKTNEGCEFIVDEYRNSTNIIITFLDENKYSKTTKCSEILRGRIKNPYFLSVNGIGFFGVGGYSTSWQYYSWKSMFYRCYSDDTLHPS